MLGRAGDGHPPLLLDPGQLWGIAADGIPGSWQARVGTLPAREEVLCSGLKEKQLTPARPG